MRKFTEADYLRMPWKNGSGITTQLAVSPTGAALDSFDWRISTAQVNTAGPFSAFPGIDRSLAVLQGPGLVLHIDDGTPFPLTRDSSPLSFAGERRVYAKLTGGPVVDFNVMTRRERCVHMLQAMQLGGTARIARQADLVFIYCTQGSAVHCRSAIGEEAEFSAGDALLSDSTDGEHLQLSTTTPAHLTITQIKSKETDHAS